MKKPKSTKPRPTHKIKPYAEWDKSVPREVHFMCIHRSSGICFLDQTYNFCSWGETCWFKKCALAQQKGDLLHVKWFPAVVKTCCSVDWSTQVKDFLSGFSWGWGIEQFTEGGAFPSRKGECRSCSGSISVPQPEGMPFCCTIRMSLPPGDFQ